SGDGFISVLIASVIGIPMYIRPETMLPIAEALVSKGMSLGTVVALIIGGAGASIPEVVLLSKLFKKKFVISFVIAILVVAIDRKSTRLNSSHVSISYAVFCLKKKK